MRKLFPYLLIFLLFFFSRTARAQKVKPESLQPISFISQLKALTDFSALPAYITDSYCAQVSSWDTTGGNDDGFSGKYSYLRKNTDGSLVIFEMKGPGVINRIWTPTPSNDSLDFYIDDPDRPAFTLCYGDLFSGKVFPFVAPLCSNQLGGYYSYLPIPFEKYCRIVYKGKNTQFHQIEYRLFPAGQGVRSFNLNLNEEERNALKQLAIHWNQPSNSITEQYPAKTIKEEKIKFQLEPGKSKIMYHTEKGGRIVGLFFEPASAFEGLAKQIDLRIHWDEDAYSAIFCPLADFFGYAFGKISMKGLMMGTEGNRNYCYFPMPFDHSATLELIYREPTDNKTASPVNIEAVVQYSLQERNPAKEGRFYAYWNNRSRENPNDPHIFLKAQGRGHYVGTLLQAQGLGSGMTYFFEGDDSTAVDGQFRMHGTGSEDYFNGGWYALLNRWDGAFSLPLSGALDYNLPFCRTGGYRLFLSDKISFEKNFFHSIEHGPTNNIPNTEYTSVGFYYGDAPPVTSIVPQNSNTKVFQPDTLTFYPQLMNLGIDGDIAIKTSWSYPSGGETFICTTGPDASLLIHLDEAPVGNYDLFLDYVKNPKGSVFSFWQKQTLISGWMDSYQSSMERIDHQYMSTIHLDPLIQTVTIRFQTKETRDQFIFNRLILVRKP